MSYIQVKQPEVANNIETCRHLRTCTLLITIYPRLLLDSFTYDTMMRMEVEFGFSGLKEKERESCGDRDTA